MTVVVLDLIPALLSWEGRDRSGLELAPDGVESVAHLYSHYRLVGIADAGIPVERLRQPLEDSGVAELFERLGTTAGFGPEVNPRVVRRITTHTRRSEPLVFVTGRESIGRAVNRSRMPVVVSSWEDFGGVPEAVATLLAGRVSP